MWRGGYKSGSGGLRYHDGQIRGRFVLDDAVEGYGRSGARESRRRIRGSDGLKRKLSG